MKRNKTILNIVALSALFATGQVFGQTDSVRVKTTTSETVTSGTQPTPPPPPPPAPATPPPAPAPAPVINEEATHDNTKEERPLRRTELGFRYYPTFSSLKVRTYDNQTVGGQVSMSHGYGAFIGHNFNHHVGVVLEVDYNQVSQKYRDRNLDRKVNINYLNIPVLLSLNTDKAKCVNWNFVVGPQFGVNVGSRVTEAPGDTVRATVAVKGGDVGAAYGTGLEFGLNREHTLRLDVGYRGFTGLVDMNASQSNSDPNTYNLLVSTRRQYNAAYIGLTFLF
jgi:hypothetical protein